MGINWNLLDTQYPSKLASLFNLSDISQRHTAIANNELRGQLTLAQLMQGANQLKRAPELQRREDEQYQQGQDTLRRGQQDEMQIRQVLQATGGDPAKAIQSLLQNGSRPALEMAAKLHSLAPKPNEPYTLSEGAIRFGPDNKPVAQGLPKPIDPNKPYIMENGQIVSNLPYQKYQKELARAGASSIVNYGQPQPVINPATGKPELVQFGNRPGAGPRFTGLSPSPEAKPPTEFEGKAAFYAQNMRAARKAYDDLIAQGFDPTTITSQVGTKMAGGITNPLASKVAQQAKQAQSQWTEQMLRMLTGAAAPEPEVQRNIATYFPVIGDSPEVIAQKKVMRDQAEQGIFSAAGRASNRVPDNQPAQPGKIKFLGFE